MRQPEPLRIGQCLLAATRALGSLLQAGMVWHLLWPALVAAAGWGALGALFIPDLAVRVLAEWPLTWLSGPLASGVVQVLLWALVLPLIYLSALLLLAALALPWMQERVAARDYADLQRRAGGSLWGSLRTSLGAALTFLVLFALSLPLWLIPGAGLVISVLLAARLNRVCFSYDALMNHADGDELRELPRRHRRELRLLGIAAGVLALVPVVNLVVPAWSGLSFVHYLLEALRCERARPLKDIGGAVG